MFKKSIFLLLNFLLLFSALYAREIIVTVEDSDIGMPLEGAVVHSWDGTETVCDEDGKALISVPEDRQVTIQITYPGYETGRLVIPARGNDFSIGLKLGGAIESRELVIEAKRPDSSETRSGRSVAISGEALERSSQIGLIEDVMTSIKLLPGVGYTGMFNALPSIRGGDPGDLMAALDGFYIENPYHWGGGFSIFDPHMVSSAQLSHGIFSTRYGHTISGLLEVTSKKAEADHAELEMGISTSAVNLNAAIPLGTGGGLMLMGKVTFWDPFVWFINQLNKIIKSETLDMVNSVTTAPYIRSAAATFNYRFSYDLELTANAFIGTDGIGVNYLNESPNYNTTVPDPLVQYRMRMMFDYDNLQMFIITGLGFNPLPSMVLKASAGAGYEEANVDGKILYDYLRVYKPGVLFPPLYELHGDSLDTIMKAGQSTFNVQGRIDFDWGLGSGFLLATGVQELYSSRGMDMEGQIFNERRISSPFGDYYVHFPVKGKMEDTVNQRFNSSAYILGEYTSPEKRFGAELGLRLDHLYFKGKTYDIQTIPVFNPRLNLDFNLFKSSGFLESLDLTLGTGLFSSMNEAITAINTNNDLSDIELKPNRSWTSVIGVKTDFGEGWSFNLEGYFKYVYDRAYMYMILEPGKEMNSAVLRFNGDGIVWGFDFMIQKFDSRYWDGWISYTFTWARYHEPERPSRNLDSMGNTIIVDSGWYYPFFHRFHNINLVLNFKPTKNFNIYTRFGLASGRPKPVVGQITSYDVYVLDENGNPVLNPDLSPLVIKKYKRDTYYSDDSRTTWSVPWDLKLSYTFSNSRNKVETEMYLAAENLFSLFYVAQANTTFNTYTGTEDTGSDSANYEMPVPMVSVGIKWSF